MSTILCCLFFHSLLGWQGPNCSARCSEGTWGSGCNSTCHCSNGAKCNPTDGSCTCTTGWQGPQCQQPCPVSRLVTKKCSYKKKKRTQVIETMYSSTLLILILLNMKYIWRQMYYMPHWRWHNSVGNWVTCSVAINYSEDTLLATAMHLNISHTHYI